MTGNEQVYDKVTTVLVEALNVDEDEIKPAIRKEYDEAARESSVATA